MKQQTLTGFEKYGKTTRRAQFLADMDKIIPWPELAAAVSTAYPKVSENGGRPPIPLERMLRIYFLQLWFNLSDPAVEEALFLTNFASKVAIVHRRNAFRAEKILQDRLFKHPKIEVVWDSVLHEVLGTESPLKVNRVRLKNLKSGALSERKVDGVFIAIGHTPASELFAGQVQMKPSGYIITNHSTATSVPGVFAAGDVSDDIYRQAVTAAGQGCMAALEAEKFLAAHEQDRAAAE